MWPRRSNGDGVVSMDDADGDGDADDDCDWDVDEFSECKLRGVWWWITFLFGILMHQTYFKVQSQQLIQNGSHM